MGHLEAASVNGIALRRSISSPTLSLGTNLHGVRAATIALLAVSFCVTAVNGQPFGGEFAASPPAHLAPPTAGFPRVASNRNGFLAAWTDFRANGDVYAARFDADGKLLDPNGFKVRRGQSRVTVASDGRDYLLVLSGGCSGALAARVTPDGVIGDWKQIAKFGTVCVDPEVTSNGDSYLVVWPMGGAVLLDREGNTIVGPFDIGSFTGFVAVASNGSDYVVTGVRSRSYVAAVPVSRRGEVGPDRPLVPALRADVGIASNGSNYLIVATIGGEFHTRLLGDGLQTLAFVDTATAGNNSTPHITWSGSEWLVTYANVTSPAGANFGVAHVNRDGTLRDEANVYSSLGVQLAPDVATSGGVSLLVWSRNSEVVFATSRGALENGAQLNDTPIAAVPEVQTFPTLTRAGTSFVLAWTESSKDHPPVSRAVLVDSIGRPKTAPVEIAPVAQARVGFDGAHIIVAWSASGTTYMRRFSSALEPVDAQAIPLPLGILAQTVTVGEGVVLVLWTVPNYEVYGNFSDVFGAIVHTDRGTLDVSLVTIAAVPLDDYAPSAAWNGTEFLITWAHARGFPPTQGIYPNPPADVLAIRLTRDGSVIDAAPRTIASLNESVDTTSAASTGREFLVVWHNNPFGYGDRGTFGKIVSNDGSPTAGKPFPLGSGEAETRGLVTIAQNQHYIVGWNRRDAAAPFGTTPQFQNVDNGQAGPITSLPELENAGSGGGVSIGAIGDSIVIAYDRLADESAGVSRVFARSVTPSGGRRRAAH